MDERRSAVGTVHPEDVGERHYSDTRGIGSAKAMAKAPSAELKKDEGGAMPDFDTDTDPVVEDSLIKESRGGGSPWPAHKYNSVSPKYGPASGPKGNRRAVEYDMMEARGTPNAKEKVERGYGEPYILPTLYSKRWNWGGKNSPSSDQRTGMGRYAPQPEGETVDYGRDTKTFWANNLERPLKLDAPDNPTRSVKVDAPLGRGQYESAPKQFSEGKHPTGLSASQRADIIEGNVPMPDRFLTDDELKEKKERQESHDRWVEEQQADVKDAKAKLGIVELYPFLASQLNMSERKVKALLTKPEAKLNPENKETYEKIDKLMEDFRYMNEGTSQPLTQELMDRRKAKIKQGEAKAKAEGTYVEDSSEEERSSEKGNGDYDNNTRSTFEREEVRVPEYILRGRRLHQYSKEPIYEERERNIQEAQDWWATLTDEQKEDFRRKQQERRMEYERNLATWHKKRGSDKRSEEFPNPERFMGEDALRENRLKLADSVLWGTKHKDSISKFLAGQEPPAHYEPLRSALLRTKKQLKAESPDLPMDKVESVVRAFTTKDGLKSIVDSDDSIEPWRKEQIHRWLDTEFREDPKKTEEILGRFRQLYPNPEGGPASHEWDDSDAAYRKHLESIKGSPEHSMRYKPNKDEIDETLSSVLDEFVSKQNILPFRFNQPLSYHLKRILPELVPEANGSLGNLEDDELEHTISYLFSKDGLKKLVQGIPGEKERRNLIDKVYKEDPTLIKKLVQDLHSAAEARHKELQPDWDAMREKLRQKEEKRKESRESRRARKNLYKVSLDALEEIEKDLLDEGYGGGLIETGKNKLSYSRPAYLGATLMEHNFDRMVRDKPNSEEIMASPEYKEWVFAIPGDKNYTTASKALYDKWLSDGMSFKTFMDQLVTAMETYASRREGDASKKSNEADLKRKLEEGKGASESIKQKIGEYDAKKPSPEEVAEREADLIERRARIDRDNADLKAERDAAREKRTQESQESEGDAFEKLSLKEKREIFATMAKLREMGNPHGFTQMEVMRAMMNGVPGENILNGKLSKSKKGSAWRPDAEVLRWLMQKGAKKSEEEEQNGECCTGDTEGVHNATFGSDVAVAMKVPSIEEMMEQAGRKWAGERGIPSGFTIGFHVGGGVPIQDGYRQVFIDGRAPVMVPGSQMEIKKN